MAIECAAVCCCFMLVVLELVVLAVLCQCIVVLQLHHAIGAVYRLLLLLSGCLRCLATHAPLCFESWIFVVNLPHKRLRTPMNKLFFLLLRCYSCISSKAEKEVWVIFHVVRFWWRRRSCGPLTCRAHQIVKYIRA
jgi:hypothetical protein